MSDRSAIVTGMDDTSVVARVGELRSRGLTAKQIARTLGLPRSTVEPLVRAHAQSRAVEPGVAGCWITRGWSRGLGLSSAQRWDDEGARDDIATLPGLIGVVVVRDHRYDKVSACAYLVDGMCLGVKNAIGPRVDDRSRIGSLVQHFFRAFDEPSQTASIELAREVVLGGEAYARSLGFAAHPDFEPCRAHLGSWNGPGAIEFGFRGRPTFVQGPDDNPFTVTQVLENAVGRGNFSFVVES